MRARCLDKQMPGTMKECTWHYGQLHTLFTHLETLILGFGSLLLEFALEFDLVILDGAGRG